MKVSQLAKRLNVAPDTVRFYTRIGLILPKVNVQNGYKEYSNLDLQRLNFIFSARQLGFSVKDIEKILAEADSGRSSCPIVRDLVEKRLKETEEKFQQMVALRSRMRAAVKQWKEKPDMTPTSEMICHLIEEFSSHHQEEN